MAILWCEGYEGYATSNGSAPSPTNVLSEKGGGLGSTNENYFDMTTGNAALARTDWAAKVVAAGATWQMQHQTVCLTSNNTLIAGCAFTHNDNEDVGSYHQWPILCFRQADGDRCMELIMRSGCLWLTGYDSYFYGGCRCCLEPGVWNFIEMKVVSDYSGWTNPTGMTFTSVTPPDLITLTSLAT
jgi:hypothetical protein